jgi:hypothetical protein
MLFKNTLKRSVNMDLLEIYLLMEIVGGIIGFITLVVFIIWVIIDITKN